MTVSARQCWSGAVLNYAKSDTFSGGKAITISGMNTSSFSDGSFDAAAGTYYLYVTKTGLEVRSVTFTPTAE